jgi:hypothetical protein
MQFSLKNTSIRVQILLPVLLTAIALLASLWYTAVSLDNEQDTIADNTASFVFYKDQLAKIDDQVYPLRIGAVYAIEHLAPYFMFKKVIRISYPTEGDIEKINKRFSICDQGSRTQDGSQLLRR